MVHTLRIELYKLNLTAFYITICLKKGEIGKAKKKNAHERQNKTRRTYWKGKSNFRLLTISWTSSTTTKTSAEGCVTVCVLFALSDIEMSHVIFADLPPATSHE